MKTVWGAGGWQMHGQRNGKEKLREMSRQLTVREHGFDPEASFRDSEGVCWPPLVDELRPDSSLEDRSTGLSTTVWSSTSKQGSREASPSGERERELKLLRRKVAQLEKTLRGISRESTRPPSSQGDHNEPNHFPPPSRHQAQMMAGSPPATPDTWQQRKGTPWKPTQNSLESMVTVSPVMGSPRPGSPRTVKLDFSLSQSNSQQSS